MMHLTVEIVGQEWSEEGWDKIKAYLALRKEVASALQRIGIPTVVLDIAKGDVPTGGYLCDGAICLTVESVKAGTEMPQGYEKLTLEQPVNEDQDLQVSSVWRF
ncbi:hypothetical protein ACFLXE_00375 [Chloroflexota bacterium]